MFTLFRALSERVKALFITTAALDFEADLLARDAERKAELLRQAQRYEAEGLTGVAEQMRRQAEALSLQRPLAGVLPAMDHLSGAGEVPATLLLQSQRPEETPDVIALPLTRPLTRKKKGR
jgi:hypothetical protein